MGFGDMIRRHKALALGAAVGATALAVAAPPFAAIAALGTFAALKFADWRGNFRRRGVDVYEAGGFGSGAMPYRDPRGYKYGPAKDYRRLGEFGRRR